MATARTPLGMVRDWVREMADGRVLNSEALSVSAAERFREDEEFTEALLTMSMPDLVYTAVRQVSREARTTVRSRVRRKTVVEENERVARMLRRWYEATADSVHKSLLSMTRADLLFAIERRQSQVNGHRFPMALMRSLAEGMEEPEEGEEDPQVVSDRYSMDELESIVSRVAEATGEEG